MIGMIIGVVIALIALFAAGDIKDVSVDLSLDVGNLVVAGGIAGLIPLIRRVAKDIAEVKRMLNNNEPSQSYGEQESERRIAEEIARSLWSDKEEYEISWTQPDEESMKVNEPWWMDIRKGENWISVDVTPLELSWLSGSLQEQDKLKEKIRLRIQKL